MCNSWVHTESRTEPFLWTTGVDCSNSLFYFLASLGLAFLPKLGDLFVTQTPREFCASHFAGQSNFNFLHNSQWITFPTQSCVLLYSFYAIFVSIITKPTLAIFFLHIRVFHISVSWWFFTGVWVTASLLKSPGLFSVFWPFSIM